MNNYTIYCTEEQTKKALELDAPIRREIDLFSPNIENLPTFRDVKDNDIVVFIPTAEQMRGWLEDQEEIHHIAIDYIEDEYGEGWDYCVFNKDICNVRYDRNFESYKEATLAAINAALDYLSNK